MQSLTFKHEPAGVESRIVMGSPSGGEDRERPGPIAWAIVALWLVSVVGWMGWLNPITAADVVGTCSTTGAR